MKVNLEQEILDLKKSYHRFKNVSLGIFLIINIGILSLSFSEIKRFDIIRAKGIVIEDVKGKDRILIGAPIPHSKDRVRTDTAKVRKHWASQFDNPDQYMGWYRKYKNSANGIVFMNDKGFDEVLVGEELADANVGSGCIKFPGYLSITKKVGNA
jgi:hypothetical protein